MVAVNQRGSNMTKSIKLEPVKSKQINAIGYDKETSTLAIQFKNWKGEVKPETYHFSNFTREQFDEFIKSESLGNYFGKNIKPKTAEHPFVKVSLAQAESVE
jgi:hypothetical protein